LDAFTHTSHFSTKTHKGFKGTVVDQTYPPIHRGSLEITLTVPLRSFILGYSEGSGAHVLVLAPVSEGGCGVNHIGGKLLL